MSSTRPRPDMPQAFAPAVPDPSATIPFKRPVPEAVVEHPLPSAAAPSTASARRPAIDMSSFVLGFLFGFFAASSIAAVVMVTAFLLS